MTQPDFDEETVERGRVFCAQQVDFVLSASDLKQLPAEDYPEICFAGRSNVGKSSLINALLNRKNLARASGEPGRTRQLNYFKLAEMMYLVDLPGYGYARASKTDIAAWTKLTRLFLLGRSTLRRVFLLIDSRRGIMDTDIEIMDMLDNVAVVYQIVLTKADKIKVAERNRVLEKTQALLSKRPASHPVIHLTSSEKGTGLPELRCEIEALSRT